MFKINAYELKEYIIQNDKLKYILESIDCFKIKSYTKEYRCGNPMHDNSTSVAINKESLMIKIYGKENKIKGDIYTLVMDSKNINFSQALKYIHKLLGLKYTGIEKRKDDSVKVDILSVFTKHIKHKSYNSDANLEILQNDIADEYISCPYIEWVKEGILPFTQEIFGIGYSSKSNRVVIPHRYWCGMNNEYVGVIGRTLIKNYDMFDIPKYFPLHKYPKSMNVYGLNENYASIQKAGYVVVYESEKSPMKRHSRLDGTGVSLCGHEISDEQVKILISLNIDIIIAMDKDISLEHVESMCDKFYGIRPVYYIYDDLGLLKDKESPADKHNKVYKVLFDRKVKYSRENY